MHSGPFLRYTLVRKEQQPVVGFEFRKRVSQSTWLDDICTAWPFRDKTHSTLYGTEHLAMVKAARA
jgi:hypothetical protein